MGKLKSCIQQITIWYIIIGGPIVLLFARIANIWFNDFLGISTITLIVISIIFSVVSLKMYNNFKPFILLFIQLSLSLIAILIIAIIGPKNQYYFNLFLFGGYVFFPALFGVFIGIEKDKTQITQNFIIFSIIISAISLFAYTRYYTATVEINTFYRVGREANAIAFSESIMLSSLLGVVFFRKSSFNRIILSIISLFISFALGSRQVFFISFIVIILYNLIVVFRYKTNISYKKNHFIYFLISTSLLILLFNINNILKPYMYSSTIRFEIFKNYLDNGTILDQERIYTLKNALKEFAASPLFGYFGYEMPGLYAHNTIINSLAQFGIIGTIPLIYILIQDFRFMIQYIKADIRTINFDYVFMVFCYNLLIAITVGNALFTPMFWFILYYIYTYFTVNRNDNKTISI